MSQGGLHEKIDMALFSACPELLRASLRLNLEAGQADAGLAHSYMQRAAEQYLKSVDPIADDLARWKALYADLGLDPQPGGLPPHAVLRAWASRPDGLPSQGPVLDLVHGFMLAHGLPLAAYDLSATSRVLWLRPSRGCELYWGLGAERPENPPLMEWILADGAELVLARHWHGAQSREVVAGPAATDLLLQMDMIGPMAQRSDALVAELLDLVQEVLGASAEARQLSWEAPEARWPDAEA